MSDLVLDLEALQSLHGTLVQATNTFAGAPAVSDAVADAIGHDGKANDLSGRVHDFADGWRYRRENISTSMDTIGRAIQAIHDAFVTADGDLAQALSASD